MPLSTRVLTVTDGLPSVIETRRPLGVAVPVIAAADGPTPELGALGERLPVDSRALLELYAATGEPPEVVETAADLGAGLTRLMLVGVGDRSPLALRRGGAALIRRLTGTARVERADTRPSLVVAATALGGGVAAFVEGLLLASYVFTRRSNPTLAQVEVHLVVHLDQLADVERARSRAAAAALARDLVNTPSSEKSPQWLAEEAVTVARRSGLGVRVHGEEELRAEGFGGLLAVGAGSSRPPCLIELCRPGSGGPHVVLVGKGITFDSGGLSLKPTDNMKLMKTDMSGGAVVIAVMSALGELGVTARVTGLVATAENMPSGSAMRPGDVITQYGGRTVEVLNTDAEGRLVLADALAYATRMRPDVIVDVATLTGAARVALGNTTGALYATDDALAAALYAAGEDSGEHVWRMPLAAEYRAALTSGVADLAHVATRQDFGPAGSIEAALFLREFVAGHRWAHLDIAGPARAFGDDAEITKGGTGFGTRLLLTWLSTLDAGASPGR